MVCLDAVNVFNQDFPFPLVPVKMCMYILSVQRILAACIQHERDGRQAVTEKSIVNGVKGPSWLRKLTKYDMINGTAID